MTREEFIDYLEANNIPYSEANVEGYDGIYVHSKKEFEEKKAHPRKNKNLFVPYIRVSHFDEDMWYTRNNGYCCYMTKASVMNIVKKMGA